MLGTLREEIATEFSVGRMPVSLTYDNQIRAFASSGATATSTKPPVPGALWDISVNRRLVFRPGTLSIDVTRGDGHAVDLRRQ